MSQSQSVKKKPFHLFAALRQHPLLAWGLFFYVPVAVLAIVAIIGTVRYTHRVDSAQADGQRTIAVAARITSFGEQIAKAILLIDKNVRDKTPPGDAVYELQIAADRLDQIINAFNDGAVTVAPDGVRFTVEAITDPKALATLQNMNVIWVGIKTRTDAIVLTAGPKKANSDAMAFNDKTLSDSAVFVAAQQARLAEANITFGRQLQGIFQAHVQALDRTRTLCLATSVVCVLALPAVFFINRVRRARNAATRLARELGASQAKLELQSQALASAKAETDRIMETVQEGLFLIDSGSVIGEQHSHELSAILRQERLAGRSLLSILERLLSERMFNATRDYIALLFDASRKEKAVLKVNPLTDIEVNFPNPSGGFINRYLGFSFRRIVENGAVVRVFVAVRDITTQIELEKKLRDSEQHKDRQLDILLGIIHVAPDELDAFVSLVERELDTVNDTLRAEHIAASAGQGDALRERLQTVFRSVHNLKGNAAALKLATFQKAADFFETKLSELLQRPVLTGDDFLSIVVAQAGLRSDLGDLMELRGKLSGLRPPATGPGEKPGLVASSPAAQIGAGLRQLVADASRELEKTAAVTIDDYALHAVAADRPALVRDVLIQLARNSIAHSIEPGPSRLAVGKPAGATLSVRGLPRTADGLLGIVFRDDGRGLDLEAIRLRAEAAGLIAAGAEATPADIARCIFEPGFSTAAQATAHSGRGMGMDIVKSKVVDEAGGAIEVHCTPGEFCEFHLYFAPLAA